MARVESAQPPLLTPAPHSHEAAKAAERQARALSCVTRLLREVGTDAMPIMDTVVTGAEKDLSPGVYMFDEKQMTLAGTKGSSIKMQRRQISESGMADSAHGVLSLDLTWNTRGRESLAFHVAAKSYSNRTPEERVLRLKRELFFMNVMKRAGKLYLSPHMLLVNQAKECVLFTHFMNGLYTLDNNSWERGFTKGNVKLLGLAAGVLGETNAMGVHDKDAKIKNNAEHGASAKRGMIDFETSTQFDTSNAEQTAAAVFDDFGLFLKSLFDKGFFTSDAGKQLNISPGDVLEFAVEKYIEGWAKVGINQKAESSLLDSVMEVLEHRNYEIGTVLSHRRTRVFLPGGH